MNSFDYEEPRYVSSEVDFLIPLTIGALVVLVNGKYLKDMSDDARYRLPGTAPSLIHDVMTSRTKAAIIIIPLMSFFNWFFTLNYNLPDWFYLLLPYYQYPLTFIRFYFQFTSFIISLMRYVFIVHQQKVMTFGKNKAKRIFYQLSIWIPILMSVLHACTIPIPRSGYDITLETTYKYLETSYNMTCGDPMGIKDDCSPILSFTQQHVSKDITKPIGIAVKIFFAVMCFNFVDGILYWKTFKAIKE